MNCPKHAEFYSKNKFEKLASSWFYYKRLQCCIRVKFGVVWCWRMWRPAVLNVTTQSVLYLTTAVLHLPSLMPHVCGRAAEADRKWKPIVLKQNNDPIWGFGYSWIWRNVDGWSDSDVSKQRPFKFITLRCLGTSSQYTGRCVTWQNRNVSYTAKKTSKPPSPCIFTQTKASRPMTNSFRRRGGIRKYGTVN